MAFLMRVGEERVRGEGKSCSCSMWVVLRACMYSMWFCRNGFLLLDVVG